MSTQVILLERIEKLGNMGDVVNVKPGYARNFLLPQKKALRATNENKAYFETQKKTLEAENDKRRKEAEKIAKKLEGLKVPLIRQASESGQLYGSVSSRDIAAEVSESSKEKVERSMVQLNQNYKFIGLYPVDIVLHPEVKVEITVNIARTPEEAETQAKTGKAMIADDSQSSDEKKEEDMSEKPDEAVLEDVLEESALEAEKEKQEAAEAKAKEEEAKKAKKAEAKAVKDVEKTAESEEETGDDKPEQPAEDKAEEEHKEE